MLLYTIIIIFDTDLVTNLFSWDVYEAPYLIYLSFFSIVWSLIKFDLVNIDDNGGKRHNIYCQGHDPG